LIAQAAEQQQQAVPETEIAPVIANLAEFQPPVLPGQVLPVPGGERTGINL